MYCNKCGRFTKKVRTCSEWKVTSNSINGEKMYAVYRLRDVNQTDHSGNREYKTDYMPYREVALSIAAQLNESEAKK